MRCDERPEYSGSYSPTGQLSAGRTVFYNSDHDTWLCHQPTTHVWCITKAPAASMAGLVSAGSSLCPAEPRARAGGWQYWDGGCWVTDTNISLTCRNHKYRSMSRVTRV